MTPSEINQDPVQGEFFSRESDLPGRLVRESIQNSLDAGREGETVRVRFTFSGQRNALPPEKAARYLDGLEEHVEAVVEGRGMTHQSEEQGEGESDAGWDALACFGAPMDYLVIEDFGTTGLTGDISANSERERDNDFWGFFRSIGISPKGEDAAGSWGLGKWVFPDASIINAYLGMTQRHGEDNWLLMGMALLKTHHLGDTKYRYYGSFGAHSDEKDEQWFPLPIEAEHDSDSIVETLRDFRMERLQDPGLSVVVPYPKSDLKPAAIARAVVTQYFIPIVRGDLVVEIVHPESGDRTIDATTITDEIERIASSPRDDESPESLRGAVELARWALAQAGESHIKLPARRTPRLPPDAGRSDAGTGPDAFRVVPPLPRARRGPRQGARLLCAWPLAHSAHGPYRAAEGTRTRTGRERLGPRPHAPGLGGPCARVMGLERAAAEGELDRGLRARPAGPEGSLQPASAAY